MSLTESVGDKKRVSKWVHESKDGDPREAGLASSLYKVCHRTLSLLSNHYLARTEPSREEKARLLESHTRLCLFGDGLLYDRALEECFNGDEDLRDGVVNLLRSLGRALLRGMFTFILFFLAHSLN
jgi:hypothetical protein